MFDSFYGEWDCDTELYCTSTTECGYFVYMLSDLVIQMDNTDYPITPSGFLVENYNNYTCAAMVSNISDSQNMLLLGDTFFRNYYVEF